MRPLFSALSMAILGAAMSGCGSREECRVPENRWYSPLTDPALGTEDALALAHRREGEAVQILSISGGGQIGAFGAGFLNGWSRSGKRPQFDIVAGVSTGGIMATFAFLGGPEEEDNLKAAYLDVRDDDIYTRRILFDSLLGNSLYSTEPFKKTLLRIIPNSLIDRVALEGATGRQLWIGTLELDRGAMVAWDMTKLALEANRSGDSRLYDRFRTILLASAAVPLLFPPVMIDGKMHVDGSAREVVFLEHLLSPVCRVCADRERKTPGSPRPVLHMIVNAKIGMPYECVSDDIQAIATRTVEVANDEMTLGNLCRVRGFAQRHGMDWRFARIPDSETIPVAHFEIEPSAMKALFDLGYRRGADPAAWESRIPDPPETMKAADR